MKIGYFDNHLTSFLHDAVNSARERGIEVADILDLSWVGLKDDGDDNPFGFNVLLVNPTLNPVQWRNLLECVQNNPHIKFFFFLTPQSAEDFKQNGLGDFANTESFIEIEEKINKLDEILQEAAKH